MTTRRREDTPEALLGLQNGLGPPSLEERPPGAVSVLSLHCRWCDFHKVQLPLYPHFTDVEIEALRGSLAQGHIAHACNSLISMRLLVCAGGETPVRTHHKRQAGDLRILKDESDPSLARRLSITTQGMTLTTGPRWGWQGENIDQVQSKGPHPTPGV